MSKNITIRQILNIRFILYLKTPKSLYKDKNITLKGGIQYLFNHPFLPQSTLEEY